MFVHAIFARFGRQNRVFGQNATEREKWRDWLAEKIGFEALNAAPCTGLHSLVQAQETKHLSEFKFSIDLIELF